jgi:glycosyltransferase involved in cell wall biosynthesis
VLFLISVLTDGGGAERFALGLATHLPRERFEPWFCFTRGARDEPLRALDAAGIPHIDLKRRRKRDVHRLWGLPRLLREQRFDVLHAHLFGSNLWGSVFGRALGVPVVIAQEHSWSYEGNPVRAFLDGRVIGRLATRFIAVSPADAERMVSYERVPKEKIVVLPTAYIARGDHPPLDLRRELHLANDAPLIATAALLRPEKAIEVLLEAHAQVRARIPDAHLVIAGDGPCRQFLEQRARELHLDGRVHFLGHRQDVDAIISAADVGALCSDSEGMPLFIFECMANRTPLVATAVGGVPTVVDDGFTGILVPARDPGSLADALVNLLGDPGSRARMAEAAFARLAPYRIDTVALRFAELYDRLATEVRSE